MAKSKQELMAIRSESYRVIHAEVCRTCRHWQRLLATEGGLCMLANAGKAISPRPTNPLGTCDLWKDKQRDQ